MRSTPVKNIHTFFIGWIVIALLSFITGCATIPQEETTTELVPISTIGVLPAQPARLNIPPSDIQTKQELAAGSTIIDSLLSDFFMDRKGVHFISQTELEGLPSAQSGQALSLAREAGQQLRYDAVLITEVIRYQARTGSAYAVDSPASVAFSFKLFAVASGQVIWSADFDQTQQTLFENILRSRSIGSGFRWLTAAELAEAGLKKKLNSCPYLIMD